MEAVTSSLSTCLALTNQRFGNVSSCAPVLKYLFINVRPYQNICTC